MLGNIFRQVVGEKVKRDNEIIQNLKEIFKVFSYEFINDSDTKKILFQNVTVQGHPYGEVYDGFYTCVRYVYESNKIIFIWNECLQCGKRKDCVCTCPEGCGVVGNGQCRVKAYGDLYNGEFFLYCCDVGIHRYNVFCENFHYKEMKKLIDLEKKLKEVADERDELRVMVDYMPGGEGYIETEKHFKSLVHE